MVKLLARTGGIYIYIQPPKCIQEESINDARALTLARVHNIIYYLC